MSSGWVVGTIQPAGDFRVLFCFSLLLYKLYVHFHFHVRFHFISACKKKAFISVPSNLESVCVLRIQVCVCQRMYHSSLKWVVLEEGGGGGDGGRRASHGGRSFIFTCHGDSWSFPQKALRFSLESLANESLSQPGPVCVLIIYSHISPGGSEESSRAVEGNNRPTCASL